MNAPRYLKVLRHSYLAIDIREQYSKMSGTSIQKSTVVFTKLTAVKISKFKINSPNDIKLPYKVKGRLLSAGKNRDGTLTFEDLKASADGWIGMDFIPGHDMSSPSLTDYNPEDVRGQITRVIVNQKDQALDFEGLIFHPYTAFLIEMEKLNELSVEYVWFPEFKGKEIFQKEIKQGPVALVREGHISDNFIAPANRADKIKKEEFITI